MTAQRTPVKYYVLGGLLSVILVIVIVVHTYFAGWLLDYVNNVLHHIDGYDGSVESIDIDLYRGAYAINGLKLNKVEGDIPTPFIAIKRTDFSIQWHSLIHGRVVADVYLSNPVINFAVSKTNAQKGDDVDWTQPIKKLMPIDINHVKFHEGRISYKDFASNPRVDIFIHHMNGEISNLRNVTNKNQPMPSTVLVEGDSIGGGALNIKGRMNILKQLPDMDLMMQIENVHLPALNDYSNAYGAFTFKDGDFSVYSEFTVKDKQVTGYIKPVLSKIEIIDLRKTSNPIKLAWESVVAGVVTLFTNHTHDQFATEIKLQGSLDHVQTNTWSAVTGIFHNAFIEALKRGLDYNGNSEVVKRPPEKQ